MFDRIIDEEARLAALRRYEMSDTGAAKPLQRIVDLVKLTLGVPMAAVTLVDADTQWIRAQSGMKVASTPRADAFCNYTISQSGPFAISDALTDPRFAGNPMVTGAPHVRSYLGVPLTTPDGYNIGSLCAADIEPRQFDRGQGEIMSRLADIVVEQLELRQIARQDPLTGALTRSGFFAEVEREFQRAARYERPSALVVIDVDRLRSINDRHGHAAGDAVLIAIANACMATMRRSDVFGRIGGEQFGLLLPEADAEEAREAAERVRRTIEAAIIQTGDVELRATVSLGVAPRPATSQGAATWLSEADIALYAAKQFGRNRVVVGKSRQPEAAPDALVNGKPLQLH